MSPGADQKNNHSRRDRPVIAIDGNESVEGRALFTLSALYWCREWLPHVETRLIDVSDENVTLAADVVRADVGADIRVRQSSSLQSPLAGVDLYAAVAFRSAGHLRLAEAAHAGIPVMLALQFPSPEYLGGCILRQRAAFNPRIFAEELHAIVKPWL